MFWEKKSSAETSSAVARVFFFRCDKKKKPLTENATDEFGLRADIFSRGRSSVRVGSVWAFFAGAVFATVLCV